MVEILEVQMSTDFLEKGRQNWGKVLLATKACTPNPASIYLFKVNNGNTRTMCEPCSKLTIKSPERRR